MAIDNSLPPKWYMDAEALKRERLEHGSWPEVERVHGTNVSTLRHWWGRLDLGTLPPGPAPRGTPRGLIGGEDDSWLLELLRKAGDESSVEELADQADCSPRRVREALARLGEHGFRVREDEAAVKLERVPTETKRTTKLSPILFDGDVFRFGLTSDVHTSSVAERLDAWELAYDIFADEGITDVFDPGDLCDGLGIYRGQVSEVTQHTYEAQVEHAVTVHPRRDGMTTHRIAGNHDLEGDFGRIGADPVQAVANQRPDVDYLGRYSARVELPNGASMHLLHPMGGASYALSYKPQKIVEGYELGAKPNILLIGHWHRAGYFFTRGVHTLLSGTFQGPTTYSVRKAFGEPGFGFWIVECRLAEDASVVRFKPEWFPIYQGRVAR